MRNINASIINLSFFNNKNNGIKTKYGYAKILISTKYPVQSKNNDKK